MSGIGLNILAGGAYDELRLLDWLDRARPPAGVVMNNGALAGRLATRYPEMLVVYRHWPDDNASAVAMPEERWRLLTAFAPQLPGVALYTQNEPSYTAECAAWEVDLIARADREGRRLVVLNAGMGGPEDEHWEGALLPLLQALADSAARRAARGLPPHVLGLHEYFDFHAWRAPGYDPLAGETWLIGRFRRLLAACDRLGISHPPVLITEHGADSLRSEYHGWRAGAGLGEADYATQLIDMDRLVYAPAPEVIGQCVFCWTASDGGWETYNVKDAPELLETLARYEGEKHMTGTTRMTVQVIVSGLAKRSLPGTTAATLGVFEPGTYTLEVGAPIVANGYRWRYFRAGESAWYSATGPVADPEGWVKLEPLAEPEPAPEPESEAPPVPEEPPAAEPEAGEEAQDTLARLAALEAETQALRRDVAELRAVLRRQYLAAMSWLSEAADSMAAGDDA